MDLARLRHFVVIAEEMNFTRAAQRLRSTQPSLSLQIRKLEHELKLQLFAREGRGIILTDAGRVFLDGARRILSEADRQVVHARQAADGRFGHLSIGYDAAAEFRVFPTLIPAFRKQWPDVRLSFHLMKNSQQLEALNREELDLAFVFLPIPGEEFEFREIATMSVIVALPTRHRLATAASVSVRDLSHEPMILFPRSLDPYTYNQIEQAFFEARAVLNVALETAILLSAVNFVSIGGGCSLLGDYARRISWEGVTYKPLVPPIPMKTIGIVKKQSRMGLTESFYRFAVAHMEVAAKRPSKSADGRRKTPQGR
jgi:DNA-binding transcriptional LysR family regulator